MMLPRLFTRAALIAAAAVLVAGGPAAAAPTPAPAPGTQAALAGQYQSLAGALINYYATSSGQTLSDYLAGSQLLLTPAASQPSQGPSGGAGMPTATLGSDGSGVKLQAGSLDQLNAQLSQAGLTLNTSSYTSMQQLAAAIAAKADTPDGAVTLAGARWATQLAALHAPQLAAPEAGTPGVPAIPQGSLVLGLFLDKSLTHMVNDYPDVFAQVTKSGLGTPAAQAAWNSSMMSALKDTQTDVAKAMPDQCAGAMMAVMASGNPTSAAQFSCGSSCATGGMYLHAQAGRLFDPSANSTIPDPTKSVWSVGTLSGLQDWQKALLLEQNPSLAGQLNQALGSGDSGGMCGAASSATSGALGSALPGVFGQLTPKK